MRQLRHNFLTNFSQKFAMNCQVCLPLAGTLVEVLPGRLVVVVVAGLDVVVGGAGLVPPVIAFLTEMS